MKIIQILVAPNDATWQGRLLGLADDGGIYSPGASGKWEPELAPLEEDKPAAGLPPALLEALQTAFDALTGITVKTAAEGRILQAAAREVAAVLSTYKPKD